MLAVVCCYFNFAGFARPRANLKRFLRHMHRDGLDVFGVELTLDGQPPATKENPKWRRVKVDPRNQLLWQKEAAMNVVAASLPPEYTHIAWVDTDVWMSDPNWGNSVLKSLEEYDVVQGFEWARWVGRDGEVEGVKRACAIVGLDSRWVGHPGFAWAMRRTLWDATGGLYPYALSGGGDTVMTLAMMNLPLWQHAKLHLGSNPKPFTDWAAQFRGVRVGHVPGSIYHEWHGTRQDRDYVGRCARVATVDAEVDLMVADNRLVQWTATADPKIVREVAKYFKQRKEDG